MRHDKIIWNMCILYFNPRTPYGMRQDIDIDAFFSDAISIHAPLTGCDKWLVRWLVAFKKFQSTHPLRDATIYVIHSIMSMWNFNPRTPYGMRLASSIASIISLYVFQSTHPLRDATFCSYCWVLVFDYFNPRTPYGMRLMWLFIKKTRL